MKQTTSLLKRAALVLMLLLAMVLLCSCYTEPDRTIDTNNLNTGAAPTYDSVITPTPTMTPVPTPTPQPTTQGVDWSSWNFGNDTATNPPSYVTVTVPPENGVTAQPGTLPTPAAGTVTATPGQSTPTVKPATPTPTPTSSTLKNGSKGAEVKKLQQRLKDLGYYTGSVDGTYGAGTEAAVKAFQKRNGLGADGKAGNNTLTKLYSSSAKKAVAATPTPKKTTKPTTTKSSTSTNKYTGGKTNIYMETGSNSANVKYMQNRLIELGYLSGTATGRFDESTEAAVIAFQKRNGLWADGVAGPSTLSLMYSSSAKRASETAATLGSLRPGSEGSAVRALQKNLKKLGYYSGSVDGSYGDGTTSAVKAFQRNNGLKADGIAGQSTLNKIAAALNGGSSSSSGSSDKSEAAVYGKTASSNGYTTLYEGTPAHGRVKDLQAALKATGYYSGNVDGNYGSSTTSAIKKFQRAKGLRVTGMAGPCTLRLLYGNKAETGSYTKLQSGDSGSKVKQLQYALYELKYYDGKITGSYDHATENAVMEFQQRNGLEVDGVAGVTTLRRLFSSNVTTNGYD